MLFQIERNVHAWIKAIRPKAPLDHLVAGAEEALVVALVVLEAGEEGADLFP